MPRVGSFPQWPLFPPAARQPAMRAKLTPKLDRFRLGGFSGRAKKPLRRGRGSRIEVPQLPHRQRHGRPRQPSPWLRRAPRHREGVLQQSLRAVRGSHHHGVVGGHLLHRPILGLEASGRIGGRTERPGFLEPPLTAPRQLVVVLELPSVILVDAEGRRLLGLHGLRRHRDRGRAL